MHIIYLFLPLLIHSGCSIPTAFQSLLHNKEITPVPALITRGWDDPVSDWSFQDKVWSSGIPAPAPAPAKGIFFGVINPAPSTEYVDFLVPAPPNAPTPEQEQQQQQQQQQQPQPQPGKLQKGENGCPTTFPSAVCDPGEGVTSVTKAALPGFLNLDKCRQNSPLMDPCRSPERLWCCADAKTQDLVGIYGRSTTSHFIQTEYNYQGLTCQLAVNLPMA